MPKASTDTSDSKKITPRKRVVRRTVSSGLNQSKANVTKSASLRKAPTRVITEEKKKPPLKFFIILILLVGTAASAMWIGSSDKGQIIVSDRIKEVNRENASKINDESESGQNTVIPVQDTPPVVEASNLRPRGVGTAKVVEPVPVVTNEVVTEVNASTTASSTEVETSVDDNQAPVSVE